MINSRWMYILTDAQSIHLEISIHFNILGPTRDSKTLRWRTTSHTLHGFHTINWVYWRGLLDGSWRKIHLDMDDVNDLRVPPWLRTPPIKHHMFSALNPINHPFPDGIFPCKPSIYETSWTLRIEERFGDSGRTAFDEIASIHALLVEFSQVELKPTLLIVIQLIMKMYIDYIDVIYIYILYKIRYNI